MNNSTEALLSVECSRMCLGEFQIAVLLERCTKRESLCVVCVCACVLPVACELQGEVPCC